MAQADLLIDSDNPVDKVIYLKSVSFDAPDHTASPSFVYTIAHGLPFVPLVSGSWSTTSDFSVNYDYFTGTLGTHSSLVAGYFYTTEIRIYADRTNIYIVPINVLGSTLTIYARVFGFEPSDSLATLSSTSSIADSFIINSDLNYPKLLKEGVISSVAISSTYTVSHTAGTFPQVMVWIDDISYDSINTTRRPCADLSDVFGDLFQVGVIASATDVSFVTGVSSYLTRIDYRIYKDKSGALV